MPEAALRLLATEGAFDRHVADLRVYQRPRRAVLTVLFSLVYDLMHGDAIEEAGEAFVGRLSYVAPYLLRCGGGTGEEAPISAEQSLAELTPDDVADVRELALYGHVAEVFPEVRRGWYDVEETSRGFRLTRPLEARRDEELDVLLSELALPFRVLPYGAPPDEVVDRVLGNGWGDATEMYALASVLFDQFVDHTSELPYLSDSGMRLVCGVTMTEFALVQAALAAIAEAFLFGAHRLSQLMSEGSPNVLPLLRAWVAPAVPAAGFETSVAALAGLPVEVVRPVLEIFTLTDRSVGVAGDGFFPPLVRIAAAGRAYNVFSPDVLLGMTSQRNVLYAFARTRGDEFDRAVSAELEPVLLDHVEQALTSLSVDLAVRRERRWSYGSEQGEADLLAYDRTTNTVLHVQAKAAIPPQGARMTRRLEGRVEEGLGQLARLRDLPVHGRDAALSAALELPVCDVDVIDVLVTRSSFGTASVRSKLGSVRPLNIHLMLAAAHRLASATDRGLTALVSAADREMAKLHEGAAPTWRHDAVEIRGLPVIERHLLDFDGAAVGAMQLGLHDSVRAMSRRA